MILIAIVDNNQQEGQALEECMEHCLKGKNVAYLIHRYDSGVEFIRSRTIYDIVFMDIQLSDIEGLNVARFLRVINKDAKLIFVTHMVQMAIYGYEVEAMDFLAKPVDQFMLNRAMNRALKCIEENRVKRFALKTPDGIVSLSTYSIYYVEVFDHDLVYHADRGDYKVRGRLREVQERLGDDHFIQCSRSHLVNMRHVQSLHSDYLMINGTNIHIAKTHHKKVEQIYLNYLGNVI